ncbi:glutathione S-transferase family protein [Vibrio fluminensis]|uniref:glutathione S-transferase family protein n=1 Tax=Vibrio fluminensis TaxID=2783614 RepID=UPI001886B725|nr:glutathione S-transferase family protein [Vibrio fluminensis]
MIKIVSFKICPFVQRVTAALEAKQIPYEIEFISLSDKPQWFLDISPNGQVPLLVTEAGTALFESDAIIEYIEDEYGPLEQGISNEQRALDRAWSYLGAKHYLAQCSTMRSSDQALFSERLANLQKAFAKVEQQLGEGAYFKGEQLSNVDIAWLPLLHRAHIIKQHSCVDMLQGFPKVQAWQQALLETGLMARSVPEDFEQVFANFYLSEQTHLGMEKVQCKGESNCC